MTDVPSVAVAVTPPDGDAEGLAGRLRRGAPAVVGLVRDDRLLLDLRAVRDEEFADLAAAVLAALA